MTIRVSLQVAVCFQTCPMIAGEPVRRQRVSSIRYYRGSWFSASVTSTSVASHFLSHHWKVRNFVFFVSQSVHVSEDFLHFVNAILHYRTLFYCLQAIEACLSQKQRLPAVDRFVLLISVSVLFFFCEVCVPSICHKWQT